jgi:hypothetical protein
MQDERPTRASQVGGQAFLCLLMNSPISDPTCQIDERAFTRLDRRVRQINVACNGVVVECHSMPSLRTSACSIRGIGIFVIVKLDASASSHHARQLSTPALEK